MDSADKRRPLVGLLLLVLVAVVILVIDQWSKPPLCEWLRTCQGPIPLVLKGLACGSKADLLKNPEIRKILKEKYQIGDIDCPATPSGDCADAARLKDRDFIWPAGLYYVDLCRKTLGKNLDYDVIYMTPIVIYSWDCVTDELVRRGQVVQKDGVYYIPDMQSFTKAVLVDKVRWDGACGVHGRIAVYPTDPVKSASGQEFVALLADMLNGGEVVNEVTVEPLLPSLKGYIDDLGYLEETSAKLFAVCIKKGMGGCPLFTVYESQGIDLVKANPEQKAMIVSHFRVLYPQPTMLADHELIALTHNGKLFLDAMKDKEIQAIQWRDHGFRTGLGIGNDPKVLGVPGIPESIVSVINSPRGPVLDRIKECLATNCAPKPTPVPTPAQ